MHHLIIYYPPGVGRYTGRTDIKETESRTYFYRCNLRKSFEEGTELGKRQKK